MLRGDVTGRIFVFDKSLGDGVWDESKGRVTILLDCSLVGEDKVGKNIGGDGTLGFVTGVTDGSSPGLLRVKERVDGEIDWVEMAWGIPDDVDGNSGERLFYVCNRIMGGKPCLVLRCGLEKDFIKSWMDNYMLFGFGVGKHEFFKALVDFRYLKLLIMRGTLMVVIDGLCRDCVDDDGRGGMPLMLCRCLEV
eukprot:scaffold34286_cov31-Cyclotella_meneghiniana.AAC.1